MNSNRTTPVWLTLLVVVLTLPGLFYPLTISEQAHIYPIAKGLMFFYPVYSLISGFLAWLCYRQRAVLTWIILVLLIMSHACFYTIAYLEL